MCDVHYKHLDWDNIINHYHQIIAINNTNKQHYPLKRVNLFDEDNNNNSILFHPLVSVYEFSSSRIHFIDIIANKNANVFIFW